MEVVLAVTALFQGSIYLLDRCSRGTRLPRLTRPRYARESGATPPVQPATAPAAPPPEGSIAELELRLANMRDEARALNSPDTFVQYARVMRNANDLERKLLERRALEPSVAGPGEMPTALAMLQNMSRLMPSGAVSSAKTTATIGAAKMALQVATLLLLWVYFKWFNTGGDHGTVLTFDCSAVRPLSFLFRKTFAPCNAEDWMCAARPSRCGVSYSMFSVLCNMLFARMFSALSASN